jgi:hypothetical protein
VSELHLGNGTKFSRAFRTLKFALNYRVGGPIAADMTGGAQTLWR